MILSEVVLSSFGTGINAVSPGHDIESLRLASLHGISKDGCVSERGIFNENAGGLLIGLDVKDEKTNQTVIKMLREENSLFNTYKY